MVCSPFQCPSGAKVDPSVLLKTNGEGRSITSHQTPQVFVRWSVVFITCGFLPQSCFCLDLFLCFLHTDFLHVAYLNCFQIIQFFSLLFFFTTGVILLVRLHLYSDCVLTTVIGIYSVGPQITLPTFALES